MEAGNRIRVAVDAMGGDYAPGEIIKGAILAAEKDDIEVILVGPPHLIEAELAKYNISRLPVRYIRADEFIKENENPAMAMRQKPDASIAVAAKTVGSGEADCLVSAGPTGAIVASAIRYLGMMDGIERPVMGGPFLDAAPNTIVLDCGVNVDCKPYHLLTFAVIGHVYCKRLLNIAEPTIGLLNIGAEEGKGNQLTREAYRLLKNSGLNFIGNVEGNEIMSGKANVLVCDAFVGNIIFKFCSSVGLFKDTADREKESDLGGGIVWGIDGVVRKIQGDSRAAHIAAKIHHTRQTVEADLVGAVKAELANAINRAELKKGG